MRNIREQAPTFAWRTNWYVGVYGIKSETASVCDTVTQPVGGLSTTSKKPQQSGAGADCQPILKFHYTLGYLRTYTNTMSSVFQLKPFDFMHGI